MNTRDFTGVLPALMSEIALGSPDPSAPTAMLNRGDEGLFASLDRLPAAAASTSRTGGATIAAHAEHLRYGFALLNRWAAGEVTPWKEADWTMAWRKPTVSDEEWQNLRRELRREIVTWMDALRTPREVTDIELRWFAGSVAHTAYHLGAIRQIDRAARGPSAEDERRAESALER